MAGPSGELDASFGDNGRVRIETPEWFFGIGHAIAEQPDGKLLLAGEEAGEGRFLVYRLNRDGSLDRSFGDRGSVKIAFFGTDPVASQPWGEATAIAVQPDGRIVVGGRADASYGIPPYGQLVFREDVGLARLNPDGTLDSSFGQDGRVILDFGGGRDYLSDLVLLPTGEIVVAGYTNARGRFDPVFARVLSNGVLDPAFGSGPVAGITIVDANRGDDRPHALVRMKDGSLIACGQSAIPTTRDERVVMSAVRVFSNGVTDTGFGNAGMALLEMLPSVNVAHDCLVTPDGTILLAGYSGSEGAENLLLAWLRSDGQLAVDRGVNGFRAIDLGASESIQGVTILADGSIAATGLTGTLVPYMYGGMMPMTSSPFPSTRPSEMLFAKFDAYSGMLDPAFGDGGVTLVDFGHGDSGSWAYGRAVIETQDRKLVAVGTGVRFAEYWTWLGEHPEFVAARIDPDGTGNPGFIGFVATETRTWGGVSSVNVRVRRTGGSSGNVIVDYTTVPGTAVPGRDFTAVSGTLTWRDGEMATKTINVPIVGQQTTDATFSVVLDNATGPLAATESRFVLAGDPSLALRLDPTSRSTETLSGGGALGLEAWLLLLLLVISTRARCRGAR
ncbi:MAG: Calx-beta domain-containing protein [Gammaproteobacteria bacterium]|nr:Calx-beta domain-containing protein [Gammaproteobacteria bacterium]